MSKELSISTKNCIIEKHDRTLVVTLNRPEAKNLIGIYSSLADLKLEETINKFSGKNFSEFKENLSQVLVDEILPISIEIKKLLNDKSYLEHMIPHHQVAVDMSKRLLLHTNHSYLMEFCRKLIIDQQGEIFYMNNLLHNRFNSYSELLQ